MGMVPLFSTSLLPLLSITGFVRASAQVCHLNFADQKHCHVQSMVQLMYLALLASGGRRTAV